MIQLFKTLFSPKKTIDTTMKYLLVGLGNIGAEYQNTRHNIGFSVIDSLADSQNIILQTERYAHKGEWQYKGKKIIVIKPTTYMNLSGKAVKYWMNKEKIEAKNVLIIVDDLAIPFGAIRLKTKGSDGGHNGLKDIQQVLGHTQYPRIRFGISNNFPKGKQIDYVLGEWSKDELRYMPELIDVTISGILTFFHAGEAQAMNNLNSYKLQK